MRRHPNNDRSCIIMKYNLFFSNNSMVYNPELFQVELSTLKQFHKLKLAPETHFHWDFFFFFFFFWVLGCFFGV